MSNYSANILTESRNETNSKWRLFWLSFILFAYIYCFTIVWLLSSEIIAIIVSLFFIIFNYHKIDIHIHKRIGKYFLLIGFLIIYSTTLLMGFGEGDGEPINKVLALFLLYGALSLIVLVNCFRNVDEFFEALLIATLVQSIIILLGILFPAVAEIIDSSFANSMGTFDYAIQRKIGYAGGIACLTSTGSLKLSLGLIASLYFIIEGKKIAKNAVAFFFISFVMIAVSRTGVLLSFAGIIVMLYEIIKTGNRRAKKFIFVGVSSVVIFAFAILLFGWGDRLGEIFKRLINTAENGVYDTFFDGYFQVGYDQSGIPPLSYKTIIGTGICAGLSGNGVYVHADGGFVRMYASIGLVLTLVFYLATFSVLFKLTKSLNKNNKIISIVFMLFLLIGEFKEPHIIFTRYMLILNFVFLTLCIKSDDKINTESKQYLGDC